MKRLEHLKKIFLNNETFLGEYMMFINHMLVNGYAERSLGNAEMEIVSTYHIKEFMILTSQENSG